jgi:hypothetical protein
MGKPAITQTGKTVRRNRALADGLDIYIESGTFVWTSTCRNTDSNALQLRKGFAIVVH